jgi:hypothetical protein
MAWASGIPRRHQRVRRALRGILLLAALVVTVTPAAADAANANIAFKLPADPDIDFFRIYVGSQSKRYEERFDLRAPMLGANGRAVAMQPQLAALVSEPRQFFFAMTTVDVSGQESAFSNEIMIDMRGADVDFDGVLDRVDNCPRMANADQSDRGGVASPSDPRGSRRDGIGDACQCGDLDNTGTVTAVDAQVIDFIGVIGAILSLTRTAPPPPPDICNVAGAPACDAVDAQAIRAAIAGRGSLQQVCVAATRPIASLGRR